MQKNIYMYILVLSAIALFVSAYIQIQKISNSDSGICSAIIAGSDCNSVQNSEYGKILGIDTSVYGILGFTIMVMLAYMQYRQKNILRGFLILLGSIVAGIMGIIFIYLQAFLLKTYCSLCLIVDMCALIIFVLSIILLFYKTDNHKSNQSGKNYGLHYK
jgi:uncharacterized membrane protein